MHSTQKPAMTKKMPRHRSCAYQAHKSPPPTSMPILYPTTSAEFP
jgi:hypothetical protein